MMNDETEQFEKRLSRQPLRKIPGAWRAEILAAARAAQPTPHAPRRGPHPWLANINHQLSALLWPNQKAWAGLAVAWILILAVNFSLRDAAPRAAVKSAPTSPEVMVELKKQQLMLAELVGAYELPDADRRKNFSPRPRSERVTIVTV
jgi:hypothetical protein